MNELGGAVLVNLLAQAVDVNLHQIGLRIKMAIPDVLHDFAAGHRLRRAQQEKFEQREFLGGQADVPPAAAHGVRREIHLQVGRAEERRREGRLPRNAAASADAVDALLAERGVRPVPYSGWLAIDEAERAAGYPTGRPREKLSPWDEHLAPAGSTPIFATGFGYFKNNLALMSSGST